jgi:hypothetical protein
MSENDNNLIHLGMSAARDRDRFVEGMQASPDVRGMSPAQMTAQGALPTPPPAPADSSTSARPSSSSS